tara:strand:+ start:332 stop:442 length:111 start_codon:yes stop_codon:yes gene_type:complete
MVAQSKPKQIDLMKSDLPTVKIDWILDGYDEPETHS